MTGTLPPASCLVSLEGDKGTFGDELPMETPFIPSTSPTASPLPSATTPTTRRTGQSETTDNCVEYKQWKITVRKGHFVEMILESINLGPGACLYSIYLIVKEIHAMSSNVLHIQCEPDAVPRRIWSSGNEMVIERYGSSSRLRANTGFRASYQAIPLSKGGLYIVIYQPKFVISLSEAVSTQTVQIPCGIIQQIFSLARHWC